MDPEKEARIKEMIKEHIDVEKYIEAEISKHRTRLDEIRRRREILEAILSAGHTQFSGEQPQK